MYEVLEFTLVSDWQSGYFILEGFGAAGNSSSGGGTSAPTMRDTYERLISDRAKFEPEM